MGAGGDSDEVQLADLIILVSASQRKARCETSHWPAIIVHCCQVPYAKERTSLDELATFASNCLSYGSQYQLYWRRDFRRLLWPDDGRDEFVHLSVPGGGGGGRSLKALKPARLTRMCRYEAMVPLHRLAYDI